MKAEHYSNAAPLDIWDDEPVDDYGRPVYSWEAMPRVTGATPVAPYSDEYR